MAKKETKQELVGIIGQKYEDRRNGQSGILISRDEKCKTLTFESSDGKSFNKSYSGFRSYMRKKDDKPAEEVKAEAYEEAELTSIEVSEEDAKKMEKNAKRKEHKAEKQKEKTEPRFHEITEARQLAFETAVKEFSEAFKTFPEGAVRLTASIPKQCISVCLYNKKHMELFVHARGGISKFIVHKEAFISYIENVAKSIYEVKPDMGRRMNVGNFIVAINNDDIPTVASIIKDYLVATMTEINSTKLESED